MSMVPDIVLVFKVNGDRKELNYRKIPFSAWSELKQQLDFTPLTLVTAMSQVDLEAIGAAIWLERKQRDRNLRWNDVRRELERDEVDFEAVGVITEGKVSFGEEDEVLGKADESDPTTKKS